LAVLAHTPEHGLELFDVARGVDASLLLPVRLDMGVLRAKAQAGMLPAVVRGLVRVPVRRAADAAGSLARRLAEVPESEWDAVVLELVASHVAMVLGHSSAEAIDSQRTFQELGFDSLSAVELRNRLAQASGIKLPATLIFDHPTPSAVGKLLRSRVARDPTTRSMIDAELEKLELMVTSLAEDDRERERINTRLQLLQAKLAGDGAGQGDAVTVEMIQAATADEIVELINQDLKDP
jgi:acyl carrier protein